MAANNLSKANGCNSAKAEANWGKTKVEDSNPNNWDAENYHDNLND